MASDVFKDAMVQFCIIYWDSLVSFNVLVSNHASEQENSSLKHSGSSNLIVKLLLSELS